MYVGTARAHVGVGDDLQDVRGTQLGHPALVVELEVVEFKSFGGTEGPRAAGWLRKGVGGGTRCLGFVARRSLTNRLMPMFKGEKLRSISVGLDR